MFNALRNIKYQTIGLLAAGAGALFPQLVTVTCQAINGLPGMGGMDCSALTLFG